MDVSSVRSALDRLREKSPTATAIGARGHGFILNRPLPETEVAAFETNYRLRLPVQYRQFLLEVGNGGAGPGYGVFPLGFEMPVREMRSWRARLDTNWYPQLAFRLTAVWNPIEGKPDAVLLSTHEYELALEEWQAEYFGNGLMDGAIPISTPGCGLMDWLVVTGSEAGHVWGDYRADERGIGPLGLPGKSRITFDEWYLSWLACVIAVSEGYAPPPVPHFGSVRVPTLFDGIE